MVLTLACVNIFVDVILLKVEIGACVLWVAANEVLKRLAPDLCHQPELFIVLKQITNF